jgi:hypothetical protein
MGLLGRPIQEDNIKMDLKNQGMREWNGLNLVRIGFSGGCL